MKILLVSPPPLGLRSLNRAPASVHLLVLYSCLRRAGVEVSVFDAVAELGLADDNQEIYLDRLRAALTRFAPDVVGVSCWTSFQYQGAMELGRMARRLYPDATLVVGGYHPTSVPEDFTGPDSPFDVVVRGPGEQPLLELCRHPRRSSPPVVLAGTPVPLAETPLDWTFPYPCHGLVLSRGCPFDCVFCIEHAGKVDCYPLEQALAEYGEAARRSDDGFVHIFDACFGVDKRWRRALLGELVSRRMSARPHLEVRLDLLDEGDIELLGKAGAHVMFGVESGSTTMLRLMRKTRSPERYLARCREVLAACDRHGVDYTASLLYNHPGETTHTLNESIDFFWDLVWNGPSQRLQSLQTHRFCFLPGLPLAAMLPDLAAHYGTRIHHPTWWREPGDHRLLSEAVTASTELPIEQATAMANRFAVLQLMLSKQRGETPGSSR